EGAPAAVGGPPGQVHRVPVPVGAGDRVLGLDVLDGRGGCGGGEGGRDVGALSGEVGGVGAVRRPIVGDGHRDGARLGGAPAGPAHQARVGVDAGGEAAIVGPQGEHQVLGRDVGVRG